MVYRQFMLQFLKQLIIISIIFILIIVTIISYTLNFMNRKLIEEDFPQYGVESFYHSIKKKNGSYSIDHKFLDKVKERNGFIQLVDTNGYVLYEYHTPKKLPKKYIGGELASYWTGLLSFPYELIVYKQNQPFILVYGEPKKENQHIKQIQQLGFIKNATLSLPEKEKSWLEKEQAIVQVLDEDGKEIAHFGKTEDLKHTYTVEELIFKIAYPNRYNQQMSLYFDKEKKQTWLLHLPNEKIAGNEPKIYQVVISVIGIGILLWMCVIIFVAYQYSKRMGKPLHDLTTWVNQLANAEYRTESMEATMKKKKIKKCVKYMKNYFNQ
ncbi:hypothetical protein ACQKCU_04805 [Heyndrickxia sporothermodurans]